MWRGFYVSGSSTAAVKANAVGIKKIGETVAIGRVVKTYAEMGINRLFLTHAAEKDTGTLRKFGGIGTG